MIKINIQTDDKRRFTIPVPYSFLRVLGSLLSSKFLWRQAAKWMNHQLEKPAASLQPLDSKIIKCFLNSIIKELQHHKGVVLVDVKVQDGTHIIVKL